MTGLWKLNVTRAGAEAEESLLGRFDATRDNQQAAGTRFLTVRYAEQTVPWVAQGLLHN